MKSRPRVLRVIAVLIALTLFRAQTLLLVPKLSLFGGNAPDAWWVPWISDAIFGMLVPVIVFVLLRGKTIRSWGALVVYNALGAFDYGTGLATQWQHPLPDELASSTAVYVGIGLFMLFQLLAFALLWRGDVIRHFHSNHPH